jgi:hypothetical protein
MSALVRRALRTTTSNANWRSVSTGLLALKDASLDESKRKDLLLRIAASNTTASSSSVSTSFSNIYQLDKTKGGVRLAMQAREDLMSMIAERKKTKLDTKSLVDLDDNLGQFLQTVFCVDALQLKRITFENSSGNVLEKVARGESVHRVRSLSELKRRLHDGRRCFALFHNCLPVSFYQHSPTRSSAPHLLSRTPSR